MDDDEVKVVAKEHPHNKFSNVAGGIDDKDRDVVRIFETEERKLRHIFG